MAGTWLLPLAYVAGSANFAIILLALLHKEDPRTKFSGNAGTTNVYRQAGLGWAAVVLLLDVGRALGIAALAVWLLPAASIPWAGASLVAGNRFPCFHRFQGGKGVASYLGFTAWISPWGALLSCFVWVAVYGLARIPFIASFVMVLVLGGATVWAGEPEAVAIAGTVVTVLLIFFSHRKNVAALRAERRKGR
ncbi:MAG: glycerol-3-phosphate acyltransferase [Deltaproteobacteria bacterium]|nr:glycerol-3-phosphate acyltransferase [Deltaproteobacteria bacterium]